MSISSLDSLQLGIPHEQHALQTPQACFASSYSALEPAGMANRDELSFAPEAFSKTRFNLQRSQFESSMDHEIFPSPHLDEAAGYSRPDGITPSLDQITPDISRCLLANDAKVYNLSNLRQPQLVYNPYQLQSYHLQGSLQSNGHHHYVPSGMYNYFQLATVNDSPSPCPTSPTLDNSPPLGWHSPETMKSQQALPPGSPCSPQDGDDEDDSVCDKPYARLIWEALMQAPGHRMMLREIYEWFERNTSKPRESGTNGWQNSIRHNLSMNQAFENDKSDPSNRGSHARKSSSVWILTDSAVKHGVQSTTRYRKTGTAKKTALNRVPAVQRQRSGAKGGQAARRAAKLRRREQAEYGRQISPVQTSPSLSNYCYGETYAYTTESDYLSTYTPATPPEDRLFGLSNVLPLAPFSMDLPAFKTEEGCGDLQDQSMHDLVAHASSDASIDDLLRMQHESRP